MKKIRIYSLALATMFSLPSFGQQITRDSLFNFGWKFQKGKLQGAEIYKYNDNDWKNVDLPHDWSIEDLITTDTNRGRIISGPFDSKAIAGKHSGFTVGGTAWYRKHFKIPESDKGKIVYLNFDGVYMNADFWINGRHLGNQPYGYTAVWFDLTNYLNFGEKDNVIAVEVKNEGLNSRWYSGSGIYRNVTISIVNDLYVKPWGLSVKSTQVDSLESQIKVETNIDNKTDQNKDVDILFDIINAHSKIVATKKIVTQINHQYPSKTTAIIKINNPDLWSPESPSLYKLVCTILSKNKILDQSEVRFGIRSISYDSEKGMFLNSKSIKLKGGALHSNNGPLGACAYPRAEERRIELLKSLGFNAIRCGHNPPSTAFLDACDRTGMLVIDEAFDVWSKGWLKDDYQEYFNEWWKHDVRNMVLRDRNHPSIFAWSIRNQAREAKDSIGIATGREMADFIRSVDPTRAVTANVTMFESWGDGDSTLWKSRDPFFENLDICGYSYQSSQYQYVHRRLPDRIQYSSEIDPFNAFKNWMRTIDHDYVIGNFTWTAQDFMGEVCLGWNSQKSIRGTNSELFSWHSSYSGDIDLCGFRRPRSYYRDILFGHGKPLSVFVKSPEPSFELKNNSRWGWEGVKPSWTWPNHENDSLTVVAYSGCDSVKLLLNDKEISTKITNRGTEFKAYWTIAYKKGKLKAIGYLNGKMEAESELVTANTPYKIKLSADRNQIKANNQDLSFITVVILDENNIVVPYADNLVNFELKGEGKIVAVGNGNPISLESFQQPHRKAYEGKCLLIIKSTNQEGEIKIHAESQSLLSDNLAVRTIK